ncbi:NAD(P)/FAD-dependent oxidoreductase [Mucilaginibacter arboris]|uniref:NADH:ubiquinone reductase (non-electrogenic) n=1 Tax=Mucilaginibacter arboris TaxID=2682090 RepID=A0A7K1SY84_9SPHI|nr:NAD(P)/FAD-dependent oxidoreductase [Mucilaginibacter arboris]MVN22281.1 NAD(P)/FAD-dependent oxidoreductase [Mucilaginibacter arboris]
MESNYNNSFPKVVIIGAGFGGIELATDLKNKEVDVLLIDKHNYHTFQPLMYQVATGRLEADSIAFSIRKNFEGQKNLRFRIAEVQKINPYKNNIETSIGVIDYDYLVIATGSTTNFFGNKEIEQHALPMKSIPEALNLRSAILQNLEASLLLKTPEEREPYLTFVLVGAGPTGAELAGSLAEIRNNILGKDYPELHKEEMKVYLVDFLPKVLANMSEQASKKAQEFLEEMNVEVLTGVKVEAYDGEVISFEGGRKIKTKNVIWSAGVQGVVPDGLPKEQIAKGNRISTDEINRVIGFNNIFAIGDVSSFVNDKYPKGLPGVAPVAIQQGKHLAKNILHLVKSEPTEKFEYNDQGSMATIGRNKAVVDLGKIKFQGFFAWLVWMFIHLILLMGFRNKVVVFINWLGSYISRNGGQRLIIRPFYKEDLKVANPGPKL